MTETLKWFILLGYIPLIPIPGFKTANVVLKAHDELATWDKFFLMLDIVVVRIMFLMLGISAWTRS